MSRDQIHYCTIDDKDLVVEFTITSWGSPATGPSWSSPGEPAEGPEIEIKRIYIDDSPDKEGPEVSPAEYLWDKAEAHVYERFDFADAAAADYEDYHD